MELKKNSEWCLRIICHWLSIGIALIGLQFLYNVSWKTKLKVSEAYTKNKINAYKTLT